jgi:hypothetical protein
MEVNTTKRQRSDTAPADINWHINMPKDLTRIIERSEEDNYQ